MPKRTDLQTILLIGSGPIVIGQGAEFDYSGTQAVKALKEEGYRVVLVNSNPATIMTDPELADRTYIEPVTPEWVAKVIERERPQALLPTMGGQTALNVAMALQRDGTLERFGVELIGANERAIRLAEDREEFAQAMRRIGLATPEGRTVKSLEAALETVEVTGYPAILRPSFTLGGSGGGIAYNREEFETLIRRGLDLSPGWLGAGRAEHHRLEGVRARGHAGQRRQCGDRLLDRESRSHGRAHRRFDHCRSSHDADRPRVPGHAGCRYPHHPGDRSGRRRLQYPVRGEPDDR